MTAQRDRAVTLRLLERNLQVVTALCQRALAEAWDSGRLAFGSEGPFPYAPEAAGILRQASGRASEQLEIAEAHLAAARAGLVADYQATGAVTPLGELRTEFGLDQTAIQILLVAAGPALWPEVARLYAILAAADPGRPLVDELMLCDVLRREGISRYEIADHLSPRSPLIRFGLVQVRERTDRARAFSELIVHATVLQRLRGAPFGDGEGAVRRIDAGRPLDALRFAPGLVDEIVAVLSRSIGDLRLVLRGRAGAGRRTLVAALAAAAGRSAWSLDLALLPREPRALVDRLQREAEGIFLRGGVPVVTGFDSLPTVDGLRDELRQLLRQLPMPLVFRASADADLPIDGDHVSFHLGPITEGARVELWRDVLDRHGIAGDPARLASRFAGGPGLVERAATVAKTSGVDVAVAFAQHLDSRLQRVARRVDRLATWDALVLPDDFLDSLHELIARVRHRRQVFEGWGFDRIVTSGRGITALLQGTPGTGKTMVAGVIARELGLELYRIDVSRVVSRWLGETEKNLGEAFDAAEDGHTILLFDEADSLFARRTEVQSANDRYANLEVNFLLQRLDSFEGIALLTTNFGGSIDPAFRRRLTTKLTFPFPDAEQRERIWRAHLPPELPMEGAIDFSHLARSYEIAGGYIRNCMLRAAFLAAEAGTPLTEALVVRAVEIEFREGGKLAARGRLE